MQELILRYFWSSWSCLGPAARYSHAVFWSLMVNGVNSILMDNVSAVLRMVICWYILKIVSGSDRIHVDNQVRCWPSLVMSFVLTRTLRNSLHCFNTEHQDRHSFPYTSYIRLIFASINSFLSQKVINYSLGLSACIHVAKVRIQHALSRA